MVRLSENFSLQEFTKSQTAIRQGIDNTPGEEHLANAKELFANVVQPVRDKFGVTVINGQGRDGEVSIAWCVVPRKKVKELLNIVSEIDGNEFIKTSWNHKHDGGGTMSKIKGSVVEKGGVNISTVSGKFNSEMQNKIPGAKTNPNYKATGISVVLHPMSPKIPSMHFNTRFLMTTEQWFGGGMDITPALNFDKIDDYHNGLKIICDEYSPNK